MQYSHFIGIDVSKKTLDVCVLSGRDVILRLKIENSPKGVRELFKELKCFEHFEVSKTVICMEHIGIYADRLLEELHKRECHIWLENPLHIKRSSGLQRGKNDSVDAHRIALYAYKNRDDARLWQPPREVIVKLSCLVRLRLRLVQARQMLAVPVSETKASATRVAATIIEKCSRKSLKVLKEELRKVEEQIQSVIEGDETLNRLFKIVTSVRGIGPVIGPELILATNEFRTITDPKKFACYAGVAPFEHSSGTSIRGRTRVSHIANKRMKKLLHLAAVSSLTGKNEMRRYYDRKVKDGKHEMSVLNAIRNKIIHRVFACVNQNRLFQKEALISLA